LTIYEEIQSDSELHIGIEELEEILTQELIGIDVQSFKGRTRSRSKYLKGKVCEALGYPIPEAFRRGYPKLPGQDLDVYGQEKSNLQMWNEEIQPNRRYAILLINQEGVVANVRVLSGEQLRKYDSTGTQTSKFQAIFQPKTNGLLSVEDSESIVPYLSKHPPKSFTNSPTANPEPHSLLSIAEVYKRLSVIEGQILGFGGTRRLDFHATACKALGYNEYSDKGTFPDIPGQLLELKLQTARTIDLGLVLPNSTSPIPGIELEGNTVIPKDIRYVIAHADSQNDGYKTLKIKKLYVLTGADFFDHFERMMGKDQNKKRQHLLPEEFFPWLR
jgi:hypothetical protein